LCRGYLTVAYVVVTKELLLLSPFGGGAERRGWIKYKLKLYPPPALDGHLLLKKYRRDLRP
jgi:hypothetical protein